MKTSDELKNLRLKSIKDLYIELKKQYKKLNDLNFDKEFRKTKDVKSISKSKQYVARIWTVIQEKLLNESNENK